MAEQFFEDYINNEIEKLNNSLEKSLKRLKLFVEFEMDDIDCDFDTNNLEIEPPKKKKKPKIEIISIKTTKKDKLF